MRGLAALIATAALAACASTPPPPPPPPPPPAATAAPAPYLVARGAQSALARYPKGTQVFLNSGICLRLGETLTVVHPRTGASVTFGEGCDRRVPDDAGDQTPATTVGARAPLPSGERNAATAP